MSSYISVPRKKFSSNNPKLYKSLGSLLKEYRQWRDISQEEFSELIKISVRELQNWEANRRRVLTENLHDLAEATGIPMQVCVALNSDQPIWYSLQKRRFAYSSIEAHCLHRELFRYPEKSGGEIIVKSEHISTDKHISMVLSCHHDLYCTPKPLRTDVIQKASAILPYLNHIIFDSWGYYIGHTIWLPLKTDVYDQLKQQKSFESYLTPEKISNIVALREGVFFNYSYHAASLDVSQCEIMNAAIYVSELKQKGRYLIASHSAIEEAHELLTNMGMRVAASYKQTNSEIYNKLYEVELDVLMNPDGPWNWLLQKYKMKEKNNQIGISESEELPLIKPETSTELPALLEKYLSEKRTDTIGALIVDNNIEASIGDKYIQPHQPLKLRNRINGIRIRTNKNNEWSKVTCPNTSCQLYGKKSKGNIVSNGTYFRKGEKIGRRFLCKKCRKSFCNRTGTIFYDLRSPEENVLKILKLLVEGKPLNYIKKDLGVKSRTIRRWLNIDSEHIVQVNEFLRNKLNMSEVEINALFISLK